MLLFRTAKVLLKIGICFSVNCNRDLSMVRAEVNKSVRIVQGACMDLDKNLRGMDSNTQAALEEERKGKEKVNKA